MCRVVDETIVSIAGKRRNLINEGMLSASSELRLRNPSVTRAADHLITYAKKEKLSIRDYVRAAAAILHRRTELPLTIITLASPFTQREIKKQMTTRPGQVRAFFTDIDAEDLTEEVAEFENTNLHCSIDTVVSCTRKSGVAFLPTVLLGLRGIINPLILIDFEVTRELWREGVIEVPNTTFRYTLRKYKETWEKRTSMMSTTLMTEWGSLNDDWQRICNSGN